MLDVRFTNALESDRRDQFTDAHEPGAHVVGQGVELSVDGVVQGLDGSEKGETISVSGNVTKRFYQRRNGETAEGRTIIADYIRAASASIAGYTPRKPAEKVEEAPEPDQPPE